LSPQLLVAGVRELDARLSNRLTGVIIGEGSNFTPVRAVIVAARRAGLKNLDVRP
jgi:hypothetical protein